MCYNFSTVWERNTGFAWVCWLSSNFYIQWEILAHVNMKGSDRERYSVLSFGFCKCRHAQWPVLSQICAWKKEKEVRWGREEGMMGGREGRREMRHVEGENVISWYILWTNDTHGFSLAYRTNVSLFNPDTEEHKEHGYYPSYSICLTSSRLSCLCSFYLLPCVYVEGLWCWHACSWVWVQLCSCHGTHVKVWGPSHLLFLTFHLLWNNVSSSPLYKPGFAGDSLLNNLV